MNNLITSLLFLATPRMCTKCAAQAARGQPSFIALFRHSEDHHSDSWVGRYLVGRSNKEIWGEKKSRCSRWGTEKAVKIVLKFPIPNGGRRGGSWIWYGELICNQFIPPGADATDGELLDNHTCNNRTHTHTHMCCTDCKLWLVLLL